MLSWFNQSDLSWSVMVHEGSCTIVRVKYKLFRKDQQDFLADLDEWQQLFAHAGQSCVHQLETGHA